MDMNLHAKLDGCDRPALGTVYIKRRRRASSM